MIEMEPNTRNRSMLWLLYGTGIRRQELCGLRMRDLSARGAAGQITVFGKCGKTRAIMVDEVTWSDISQIGQVDPDAPVFKSRLNRPISAAQLWRVAKAAAVRAGLSDKVSTHWMRHAHASHSLDNGASLALVQQTLGHANVATTGGYLHVRPN